MPILNSRLRRQILLVILLAAASFAGKAAGSKSRNAPVRTAASSSSDQKTFSLILEPKTHPFCNRSEYDTKNQNRKCEAENLHALLAPSTCLARDANPDSGATWDLSPDPFVSAPYIKDSLWSSDPNDWNGMDQSEEKCLAGKADVVLERAYKYGFCNQSEYALSASPQLPAPKFGLDQADYYLLNIVAWKGTTKKGVQISAAGGLTPTSALGLQIDVGSGSAQKSSAYSAKSIAELIQAINADKMLGATAALTDKGQVMISVASENNPLVIRGLEDIFGAWTSSGTTSTSQLTLISSNDNLTLTTPLLVGVQIDVSSGGEKKSKSYSGNKIGDLITAINTDHDLAKATLSTSGHLQISPASNTSDISVTGDPSAFGTWTNIIEGPYSIDSSRWYSYNHGDHGRWYRQRLDDFSASLRIYGSKKPVGLVALYVENAAGVWDDFSDLKVQYKVDVKTKTAANISDLTSAISIITTKAAAAQRPSECAAPSGPRLDPDGFYGATFLKVKAPADLAVSVEVDFPAAPASGSTPPKSAPPKPGDQISSGTNDGEFARQAKLQFAVLKVSASSRDSLEGQQAGGSVGPSGRNASTNSPQHNSNGKNSSGNNASGNSSSAKGDQNQASKTPTAPTVDCQPTLDQKGQQTPCKLSVTYNDEDLYHWDVSFGAPFRTLNDIQYQNPSGNGSTVIPKNVTRLNAFGFFDIFPQANDITDPPLLAWPHIKFGLPISGKVFNKPFFGAGDGFNLKKIKFLSFMPLQVQFFGGVDYNKEFRQIPGTKGAANVSGHRVWKGLYGIEIPVGQFKGLLSSGKNNSKQTSSTGNSKGTGTNNSGGNNSNSGGNGSGGSQ